MRPPVPDPPKEDTQTWQMIAAGAATDDPGTVEAVALVTTASYISNLDTTVEDREADGVRYFVATPVRHSPDDPRVLLFLHGGGFTFGGGPTARKSTQILAGCYEMVTWGVDYRQLPDAPFPAGLDDCVAVYMQLLESHGPEEIFIGGQSGGANLCAALLLRLHDEGIPFPAAAALVSPPADFTEAGDTYVTNSFTLGEGGLTNMADFYRGDFDLDHPYVSPLFGTFGPDFPPVILTTGTRDFLLSDTVRLHRKMLKAGMQAELHVWEAAPHGMFGGRTPEDQEVVDQNRKFFDSVWNPGN